MKKLYAMMAIAALCLPATAKNFEQDAFALTTCIGNAEAKTRPTTANWIVAIYVEGGYKYSKVETVDGVKSFVEKGDFFTYDEATKTATDLGTTNAKIKTIFTGKHCDGFNFSNIAMNNGIGEVTIPSKIYVDGTLTADAAQGGDLVFRYGFGTSLRPGLTETEIDLNKMDGFEVGMELPDNNKVEVTFTTSLYDIKDGIGSIGHVIYYEMGNTEAASSSNPNKVKLTNVGAIQGDKEFLSFVPADKAATDETPAVWYHVPVKWLDVIVRNVKPGDTVGIYSLKSSEDISGVDAISAENENAPVEYFNLQGMKVQNPANGMFIMRQGNKVSKVLVK